MKGANMMMHRFRGFAWLLTFVFVLFLLGACTSKETAVPTPTLSPPTATPSPIPPTATFTPAPTRTPAPTARPLAKSKEEAGRYQNDLIGISLEYPPAWEILYEEDLDSCQISITNPDAEIVLYIFSTTVTEDEDIDYLFDIFNTYLIETMGIESFEWEIYGETFTIPDGVNALQAIGSGSAPEMEGNFYLEVIGAQRGNRIFWINMIGTGEAIDENHQSIDAFRQNLTIYSPRPYGVDRNNALFFSAGEPETLDPAKCEGSADSIISDLYSGLVQLDTDLQPIPDLAERWEVSSDGKVYTFHLRKDVLFHNGKPFTAQDVIFSWNRAVSPDTESNTAATYLGDIEGVSEVIDGDATEISGLRILDDHTVEVTLDAPKAYFLSKLSYPTSWIVDSYSVNEIEERPNGTGPFKLVTHDENEVIILARNANYHRNFVQLEYIVYLLYPGYSIRLYEAGDIDFTGIDEDLQDRANDPDDPLYGTLYSGTGLCTHYFAFDTSKPPFDDFLVRKAFALAIDKDRYNDVVHEGKGVVAQGLYPPGLPGHNADVTSLGYDPDEAVEALKASSYQGPTSLPYIVLTTSGAGTDLSAADALVIQMWEQSLDVEIDVEQIDYDSFTDRIYKGEHGQIVSFGWCADYPDPENFADILFHTGSKQNISNYSNPELDALLEQARSEMDVAKRMALYGQIEQRIVDEIPALFISHSRAYYYVFKPYVRGYVHTPVGVAQSMNFWIERED
jgi:oligopeptide transport system substrate-binding protein